MGSTKIMTSIPAAVLKEIGLDRWPPIMRDKVFWFAVAAGVFVWLLLWLTVAPTFSIQNRSITLLLLTSIIYYPVLEEVLFRGIVQGWLLRLPWGNKKYLTLTSANWLTSSLFVAAHFWYQPMLWALMVIVPSLVYGFFRDRYSSIYPCIILHAFYNGGFVLINLLAQR